ncbi:hypothetical protein BDM02DRAFT_3272545 [Thelephora ganbajun]|uniref:Uncharacterized protein n=1 Tax=Thelephora ganbajun TaxID=370292 RepID=A0ACB6Z420_THEGA|nr:hypothetical protein BDM02DRAFT_3272545 [Thelephora ganbajun]
MEDLNERIGFTNVDPNDPTSAGGKLTHNEMNEYKMYDHIAVEVGIDRVS